MKAESLLPHLQAPATGPCDKPNPVRTFHRAYKFCWPDYMAGSITNSSLNFLYNL
jgi:hypothetical protein